MNWKNWIPLVLAVVLGLVAAAVARESLKRNRVIGPPLPKTIKVVVAKGPVAPGQEITADLLTMGPIAAEVPPPGAFTDPAALAGRIANAPLFNGQPVMEDLLAPKGAAAGIQALLPRGMRAITVAVDETTGLAGMLQPGARVDVISTLTGASKDDTVASTIVQNVPVQAVGSRLAPHAQGDKEGPLARSVTLVVTPREAESIELASSMGRIRLVLRGPQDREMPDTVGVTFYELRGDDKERIKTQVIPLPQNPVAVSTTQPSNPKGGRSHDPFEDEAPPKRTVTVFRGGAKTEVTFELAPKPDSEGAVTRTNNEPLAD